ncbi:MAG: hypothetical protein Q9162_006209 [Coniocarpon cinnabarinum]
MSTDNQSQRLRGKVAIVTGAASGFGRSIATRFAQEGCRVLAGDVNDSGAAETVENFGGEALGIALKMDVTSDADWKTATQKAESQFGRLDIVVNNAGWSYKNKVRVFLVMSFQGYRKSIFWSVQAAVPALRKVGGGSIINISSIGSVRPRPGLVWYNSSKGAVANATKGLAAEYGPDQIRVNGLLPLLSGTGLFEAFVGVPYTPENVEKYVSQVPMGRLTDPVDVANSAGE